MKVTRKMIKKKLIIYQIDTIANYIKKDFTEQSKILSDAKTSLANNPSTQNFVYWSNKLSPIFTSGWGTLWDINYSDFPSYLNIVKETSYNIRLIKFISKLPFSDFIFTILLK